MMNLWDMLCVEQQYGRTDGDRNYVTDVVNRYLSETSSALASNCNTSVCRLVAFYFRNSRGVATEIEKFERVAYEMGTHIEDTSRLLTSIFNDIQRYTSMYGEFAVSGEYIFSMDRRGFIALVPTPSLDHLVELGCLIEPGVL